MGEVDPSKSADRLLLIVSIPQNTFGGSGVLKYDASLAEGLCIILYLQ